MTQLTVTFDFKQVLPIVAFVIMTMFCVIGNVLKGFETGSDTMFGGFSGKPYVDLWGIGFCESKLCCHVTTSDLDTLVGEGGSCDDAIRHLEAAGAFGVITSVLAGCSTFLACVLFLRNNITPPKTFGIVLGVINFIFTLTAFVLYITINKADCIEEMDSDPRAGPFMYLAAFVISLGVIVMYALQDYNATGRHAPPPTAQSQYYDNNSRAAMNPRPATRPAEQFYPHAPQQHAPPQAPVQMPQQAPQQWATPQPAQTRSPQRKVVSAPTPAQPAPVVPDELWPDGHDWVVDETSGLLWSEEKHLFFDRQSGQFFDPKSDQWFDPEGNRWYKIQS